MINNNKYEDMSALQALKLIKNRNMLLPDIQREYCWEEKDIESLFESIVDGYPIGSFIFWKTNKKTINEEKPNLYYFLEKCKKDRYEVSKNDKAPEVISEDGEYYIVLDGQQRLTSLNIALFGVYITIPKHKKKKFEDNWVSKELYYNLDFYSDRENDIEDVKRFKFLSQKEAETGNYYKVKKLLEFNSSNECLRSLISLNIHRACEEDLSSLYIRLNETTNKGLIHYYCINEDNYDIALDIFVRVNSTGKKLTKTDLLFSTLIDNWNVGRDEIDSLIESINSYGDRFSFTRDYLMRLCLVLEDADTNLKIQNLNKNVIYSIRKDWDKIKSSLSIVVKTLVEIGLSDEYLISYNATMPLVYYVFKGGDFKDNNSKNEIRKFIAVSNAKSLFGVASNSALSMTRLALKNIDCKKTPFSLSLFENVLLTGGRSFIVHKQDIEYWLDKFEKGQGTYVLLTLLYPNLKLGQMSFHQDHIHPSASFNDKYLKSLNIDDETKLRWQRIKNTLPNLQFLEGKENESKNKDSLIDWINEGNDFLYHPKDISLDIKDFDAFYNARKELLFNKLSKVFNLD